MSLIFDLPPQAKRDLYVIMFDSDLDLFSVVRFPDLDFDLIKNSIESLSWCELCLCTSAAARIPSEYTIYTSRPDMSFSAAYRMMSGVKCYQPSSQSAETLKLTISSCKVCGNNKVKEALTDG